MPAGKRPARAAEGVNSGQPLTSSRKAPGAMLGSMSGSPRRSRHHLHQHFRRRGMSGELGDSIEISEGRHASAVRAEEVKVELMRVNVFAPYEMAMRQKDQVVKMYGKVTDEHIFVLSSAKQRAEQMLPLRQDVEKQIAAILAREQDENDRRTRREEEAIAEEEGEMEAQVREQEEEMIAKAQDKQLLQKEIQRADGILKNELAKITREREGTKADFNLQRSDEERRAQERVDLLRQAQLREEEDMRRAFAEWKYGRETDANRHRNKLQLSTDAVRIQIERAREEQGDRTDAMVALRQDLDGAQERAGQARDVAAGAREDAARGLEEAEAAAGVARAEVDERELEAAGVVEEGVALQRAKWRELDDVEAKERRLITEKRLEALREAKENMRTIRRAVEDMTGEQQDDPTTKESAMRRNEVEREFVSKLKSARDALEEARAAEERKAREVEGRQKEWSAEAERRHEALWSKVMREREAAHAEMTKALEALDARRRQLAVDRVLAEDEFNKGVPEARSAVVRRVKEVTRKFDGQMDAQLDSCSRTKAVVDAHRLTLASAKRARRTAMDRLTRDLRMREHEWDKERKGERRQLAQLQEDMERAQQDLEMRRGETGADLEERREQLKLQIREVEEEMRKASEEAEKDRDALESRCRLERADLADAFEKRRETLAAQRQKAQEKVQKTTDVSMAVLEPIEQLAADADELQADLGSLVATMEAERRQLQEYEEQTDADIRKKLVEADGTCNQVGRDAQERLAREQAKFAEEKAVINAEADHILAGIGTRRGAIRGQMVALQKSLTTIEADIQRKLAMAGESAAELRPELERHEEEKMLQADVDMIDEQIHMGRHVGDKIAARIKHEAACCAALHARLKLLPVDHRIEARAAEFEAAKIKAELEWLQQEDRSLLMQAESVRLRADRMINAKKAALATVQDIIMQEATEEQRRIKSLAQTYKADFRSLPNERKNMLAAIAYKLSQLRVDVQKVDRNIALISASISYRLTRSNRDEVTELRHVALQQAQLAVEENKAVVDLEQAIRLRFNELERREQATLGNIRRRKAALEGQLRALPSSQQDSDRFMRFLNQTVEARTRAYEGFKMQVGQNEMGRTAEKERMQKEAEKESMAAGVSVEDGEKMVEEAEGLWEAEEVKLQALDEAYRQALLEATKEPELEELRARLKEKMTAILAEEDKVKEEEEGREVELRDKMIAIKKEAMEAEKDLRQWVRDREQEQRDAADELSMSRAHVEVALKAVDRAHADLEDLRRRNGVATVVELKNIELESTVLPRETLKRQFGVEDQLRKDLEEVAEEEAEVERSIMERRAKARGEVGRQLDGVARAREVAEDARRAWVEAWEVVVEKHRVMLDKRQAAGTAERDAEARAAAGAEAKRVLREQGQRSDAIEDKGEEQIRDIEEKLRARLTVIDGKLAKLIKEKEDELQATVAESMKELRSLEATVVSLLDESRKELVEQERSSLEHLDEQQQESHAAAEAAKERAAKANEERVAGREAMRKAAAEDRLHMREFQAQEHRRLCLKYEKEMLYMGKTLEKILAELQAAVAREEVRLEEARQAEVRRLEIQAKLEMEEEMKRQQEEVARKYAEQQRKAEEEADHMRKQVMEELSRMEEDARVKIEEEVRKMQMLQVLMQQEAMVKMEAAMRSKMADIQKSFMASQDRLEANLREEREKVNADIENRRAAKLEKLTGAWRAAVLGEDSAAAGAGGGGEEGGDLGATADSVVAQAIEGARKRELEAYEEEKRRMEAELAAIEAEIQALTAEGYAEGEKASADGAGAAAGAGSGEGERSGAAEEQDSAAAS